MGQAGTLSPGADERVHVLDWICAPATAADDSNTAVARCGQCKKLVATKQQRLPSDEAVTFVDRVGTPVFLCELCIQKAVPQAEKIMFAHSPRLSSILGPARDGDTQLLDTEKHEPTENKKTDAEKFEGLLDGWKAPFGQASPGKHRRLRSDEATWLSCRVVNADGSFVESVTLRCQGSDTVKDIKAMIQEQRASKMVAYAGKPPRSELGTVARLFSPAGKEMTEDNRSIARLYNRWGALYSITELRMVLQLSGPARKSCC